MFDFCLDEESEYGTRQPHTSGGQVDLGLACVDPLRIRRGTREVCMRRYVSSNNNLKRLPLNRKTCHADRLMSLDSERTPLNERML